MPLYFDTFRSAAQQYRVSLLYVAGTAAIGAVVFYSDYLLGLHGDPKNLPAWYGLYATAQDIVQVLGVAALQTACFALLGSHMDRPAWRCSSLPEAFRRFFPAWLIINLISVLLSRLQMSALSAFGADAYGLTEILILVGMVILPVTGACVMHHGRPDWHTLGEALSPLARFPLLSMQAMIFPFAAYILRGTILLGPLHSESPAPLYYTLLVIPFALFDLFGFLAMWRVCMHNRDHGHQENNPYDF